MDKKTFRYVVLCSCCFLALVYGAAYLDRSNREANETQVMKEEDSSRKEKVMYLTFDDGPSANTQKVLDILDACEVKATFFVTGENPAYADVLTTIKERGHAIGIHTFSHDYKKIYGSPEAYFEDLDQIANLIMEKTGEEIHMLRFPGGSSNTVSRNYCNGIMSELIQLTIDKGYQYYDWNAHNGDGDPGISSDSLYERAIKDVKGKDEVIMLMHDGGANKNTVASLEATIKEFQRQGYIFKVIDESTPVSHHHVAN